MTPKNLRSIEDVFKEENITNQEQKKEFYGIYGDIIYPGISGLDKIDYDVYQDLYLERTKRANPYKGKRKSASALAKTRKKVWESNSPGRVKRGINLKKKRIAGLKSDISGLETKLESEQDPDRKEEYTVLLSKKIEKLNAAEAELKRTEIRYAELMEKSEDIVKQRGGG